MSGISVNNGRLERDRSVGIYPLASALALLDRLEEAKIALKRVLEMEPDFSPHFALAAFSPLDPEALRPLFRTWIDGLHIAGLDITDEPTAAD